MSQKGQGIAGIQEGEKRPRRARHGRDSRAETTTDGWVPPVSVRVRGSGLRRRSRVDDGLLLGRACEDDVGLELGCSAGAGLLHFF